MPKDQPSTPTKGLSKQQGKEDASKGPAADKKEGKSIQDTAVYGEIVQNLVGLHEFGKEAAAARQDGDVQTGGIKEPIADAKKKEKKAPGAFLARSTSGRFRPPQSPPSPLSEFAFSPSLKFEISPLILDPNAAFYR
jgi:hypothetical protein